MSDIQTLLVHAAARAAHEANRTLQIIQEEDYISPCWDETDENIKESAYDGVRKVLENPDITPRQLHENWIAFKLNDGWSYGPERIDVLKQHPCMCPYDDLPKEQRNKDAMFQAVVRAVLGL